MPAPHWIALADAGEEVLVNTALLLAEIDPNEDGSRPTDCLGWMAHEQDIRRALGLPARLTGVSSGLVQDRILDVWQERFRNAVAMDGLLRLSVGGARPAKVEMTFGDGGPIGVLDLDLQTLARLACGRGERSEILRSATVAGSREVIDAVLEVGVITP
ncbi:MAG: hypothetical protein O3C27_04685 [Actinomycetota bacterium]|nr:hypothetical protein [Actinomycetota bacterium]